MRSGTSKDALARLKWKDRIEDWSRVAIVIRHHGAPGDRKTIAGSRVTGLGASFFEIDAETSIPYHRILRVELDGEPVYVRSTPSANMS